MLRGLSGAMDVTDFSIVEQWLPRAKAAVAEGPRLEAERRARPCVTWPTERFDAAVTEQEQLAVLERQRQGQGGGGDEEQQQVLLISEGGGGQEKAVWEAQAAAVDDATAAGAAAALPLPLSPPSSSPPPLPTTDRPPLASSSSTSASATIKPTQVTPEVPSTVAYSAEVVGAAPTHLQELVATSEKKKREESASNEAASAAAAMMTRVEAPKSAFVSSPVARTIPESSSSDKSRAKGMRVSFRAIPALEFVAVGRVGEKEEREEVGAAAKPASATKT